MSQVANIDLSAEEPNEEKGYQKINIKGEIDRDTIEIFKNKMEEFIKSFNQKHLVLNMENLEFINSEGIGFLSDIQNRLSTKEKSVAILNASDRIMDIFQLVGLDQIITCCSSMDEFEQNI